MMNDESNVLPCLKRAFSDVLEGLVVKNILDPHGSLKEVGTFVHDKCFSIDHLHLKAAACRRASEWGGGV